MSPLVALTLLAGLALLIGGGELLVRGASRAARRIGLSPLVIGLTVVAFGTSAPELAISTSSALRGEADFAVGNVVGSNIFNVLAILGLTAVVAPLVVARKLVRFDLPLMIGVSVLTLLMALDGELGRFDGFLLAFGLLAYLWWSVRSSRSGAGSGTSEGEGQTLESGRPARLSVSIGLVVLGLGLLVLGSRWFVSGASEIARALGVSELVIGLTVVALGTSMPEVVTSMIAALRGERDIAVGNVVGSNIFNLLAVLGLTAVVAPSGVAVAPAALATDLPVMVAVAVVSLPLLWTGYEVSRWEGGLLLGGYAAYAGWLVLGATGHPATDGYATAMKTGVLPAVTLLVGISAWRWWRSDAAVGRVAASEGGAR